MSGFLGTQCIVKIQIKKYLTFHSKTRTYAMKLLDICSDFNLTHNVVLNVKKS